MAVCCPGLRFPQPYIISAKLVAKPHLGLAKASSRLKSPATEQSELEGPNDMSRLPDGRNDISFSFAFTDRIVVNGVIAPNPRGGWDYALRRKTAEPIVLETVYVRK